MDKLKVCITAAAGNLGGLTANHLLTQTPHLLHLMYHKRPIAEALGTCERVQCFQADLEDPSSLDKCVRGCDVVVHFAGKLFYARPEKFLPTTNITYFHNLLQACKRNAVKRVILISFPHVEGETTPENPSSDKLDQSPESWHARTRLEEEKLLLQEFDGGVVLRVGMVYGDGILMPDAARWFARRRLLGVWKRPTTIHLISKIDFLRALTAAIEKPAINGTYNLGDDGVQTLQEYLDAACVQWGCKKPWRMPEFLIFAAASLFETFSALFKTKSPLTRDFVKIGMSSYYGDTSRMKRELLPELEYPTMKQGLETLGSPAP